jgi:PTH1 family peptidyl-tRNA hydrolase
MYLIVGLGNPGTEYAATRHNLGFRVIDELAGRLMVKNFKEKSRALIAETLLHDHKIILTQPQTFMNNSGPSVRGLLDWFKISSDHLILIYDDVDLDVGMLRLREKGNAGGHHGVESVIASVGTTEFPRVRLGISRPSLSGDVSDYVLQKIPPGEQGVLAETVVKAADAVEAIVRDGIAKAMSSCNK